NARGNRGSRIDGDSQRGRSHAGVAGRIGGGGSQAVGAIGERRGGVAPGPAAVRGGAAQQGGAVIDLDRAVGFRRAGQGQRVDVGDVVTHHAGIRGERGDARRHWRHGIDGDSQRGRSHAGVAGRIGGGGSQAVGAIGERRGGVAPGPGAIGGGTAQQRRAVIDLDRAVGFRRTGQR